MWAGRAARQSILCRAANSLKAWGLWNGLPRRLCLRICSASLNVTENRSLRGRLFHFLYNTLCIG
jgi:hypothetical protein